MALMPVLFGIMVTGCSAVWGIREILAAIAVLPLSVLASPAITWSDMGVFPWIRTAGLPAAVGLVAGGHGRVKGHC